MADRVQICAVMHCIAYIMHCVHHVCLPIVSLEIDESFTDIALATHTK